MQFKLHIHITTLNYNFFPFFFPLPFSFSFSSTFLFTSKKNPHSNLPKFQKASLRMHKHPTHSFIQFKTSLPFSLVKKSGLSPRKEKGAQTIPIYYGGAVMAIPFFILLFHKVTYSKRAGDAPCNSHPNSPFFSLPVFVYPARGTKKSNIYSKISFFSLIFFHFFNFFISSIFSIVSFSFSFFLTYSFFFLLSSNK